MSHHDYRAEASAPSAGTPEVVPLSGARTRAEDEVAAAIALELNGPLTALILCERTVAQSSQFAQAQGNRVYLQQVVDNALEQAERVYAMVKQLSDGRVTRAEAADIVRTEGAAGRARDRASEVMLASNPEQKPLTRREREVLTLISEGYSNKEGALRMNISPRTFESHRAEAMRKLGAKNAADLVRKALTLQSA